VSVIAFLGTGTMGLPMARNLVSAGFELRAWNRSRDRAAALANDAVAVVGDPREAAQGAQVLVTMLSDAAAVLDTAAAALDALPEGGIWIQMSTIGLEGTEHCARLADRTQTTFVDSPVLGTREPAQRGQLIVLASGPDAARERCQPVFDAVGQRTLWLGPAGFGTRCKVVVNSWVVGVVGALAETITLAQVLDVGPERFFEAIEGGALDLPYARLKGALMIERNFDDPAFRLALARKDADLILAAMSERDLELPIMRAVADRLRRADEDGHGEEDMAATYWATAPELASRR